MDNEQLNNMSDIEAIKKWNEIPEEIQKILLGNVFCSNCGETTIVDYTINYVDVGIVLKGICAECGERVARVID